MKNCYNCQTEWSGTSQPTFREECPKCGKDLHCCLGCRHYSPGSHYDCSADIEEKVNDKEKANRCGEYQMAEGGADSDAKNDKAKKKFDDLFK